MRSAVFSQPLCRASRVSFGISSAVERLEMRRRESRMGGGRMLFRGWVWVWSLTRWWELEGSGGECFVLFVLDFIDPRRQRCCVRCSIRFVKDAIDLFTKHELIRHIPHRKRELPGRSSQHRPGPSFHRIPHINLVLQRIRRHHHVPHHPQRLHQTKELLRRRRWSVDPQPAISTEAYYHTGGAF